MNVLSTLKRTCEEALTRRKASLRFRGDGWFATVPLMVRFRCSSKSTGTLDHPQLSFKHRLRQGEEYTTAAFKSRSKRAFTSSRSIIQKSGNQRPGRETARLIYTNTPQAPFGNSRQSGDFHSPAISLEHSMSCICCCCDVLRRKTSIPASDRLVRAC